ncbi:MAG TPA: DUF1236 domain-containing protein [Bradyrhizobium sp.]|uniref:DUF1236 domain-containing protein n=1 Tax=Bradyrhizobium sp. TaxID=376 RepID=UPI002C0DC902|nr:DUF1236 domain-containing protein [Bradyrhizobium sp.]HLZ01689.1 DUF1236 domain-containing protein [Bradyrhizobium sp.]
MSNRFLISVAAVALFAGTGFANAQGTGAAHEPGGGAMQQSAPSAGGSASERAGGAAQHHESQSDMKSTQSEQKSPAGGKDMKSTQSEQKSQPGSKDMKSTQSEKDKSSTVGQNPRSEEAAPGQKSKGMSSEHETKGSKEIKAQGREGRDENTNAQREQGRTGEMKSQTQTQTGTERSQTTTTGQAGAGAKLSTEQRTKITTVIREQHVAPVNNVDFSISVGTRVPRERVSLHPLPAEVVTIYPEWRGYEFILVRDQIVVVDPHTLEIVAILET